MTSVHDQIHTHFVQLNDQPDINQINVFEKVHDKPYFLKTCFLNYTPTHPTLRLTAIGHTILKRMYECWSWNLSSSDLDHLNRGHSLVQLHNKMVAPYYWDRMNFYVYHSESAMEYELVSRDFPAWIRNIS